MTHQELMKIAIEEAKQSSEPLKCGVVIAKDGKIIAKDFNRQRKTKNATAHAEILAIGQAGKHLGNKNLEKCVVYCTCEPCTMCLSAMVFAKIPKLYYGVPLIEASPDHLPINLTSEELIAKSKNKIEIVGGFLKEECSILLNK